MLDLLVSASEGGGEGKPLDDDEIISNCLIFLFAAYDTTSLTLTCASHLLATNPHIQDKLCSLLDHYWDKHKVKMKISTTVCNQLVRSHEKRMYSILAIYKR